MTKFKFTLIYKQKPLKALSKMERNGLRGKKLNTIQHKLGLELVYPLQWAVVNQPIVAVPIGISYKLPPLGGSS